MKKYKFWKENKLDQEFELTLEEFKTKFFEWMKTKEKSWLSYYCMVLVSTFISDKDGLNSISEELDELTESLRNEKWKYLTSIGIN